MNILNLIDRTKIIDLPFNKIYPLTDNSYNTIVEAMNAEFYTTSISNIKMHKSKLYDIYIFIDRNGKPMTISRLEKIINILQSSSIPEAVIITAGFSSKCYTIVDKNITLFSIDTFMSETMKPTYELRLGRKYNKRETNNMSITVRIPIAGYPELGFEGPLIAEDIYKIIDSKIKPIEKNNVVATKTAKLFFQSFKDMLGLINNNKNITASRWNNIMNKYGVIDYLKTNGKKLKKEIENV
jgi:hypothetical protein